MNYIEDVPTGVFILLSMLFAALIGFGVQRYFAFLAHCTNFRLNFDHAYTISISNKHAIGLFKIEFLRHQRAAVEFRNHLNGCSKHGFDRTLQNYKQWGDKILSDSTHTTDGVYALELAHKGRNIANEFKVHIGTLLSYATP